MNKPIIFQELKDFLLIMSEGFDVIHIVPDKNESNNIFYRNERYLIDRNISAKLNYYGYMTVWGHKGWKVFIPYLPSYEQIESLIEDGERIFGNIPWIGMESSGQNPGQGVSFTIGLYTE